MLGRRAKTSRATVAEKHKVCKLQQSNDQRNRLIFLLPSGDSYYIIVATPPAIKQEKK